MADTLSGAREMTQGAGFVFGDSPEPNVVAHEAVHAMSLQDIIRQMHEDVHSLREEGIDNPAVQALIDTPAPEAMLRTLHRGGIDELSLPDMSGMSAEERVSAVMLAGHEAMHANGITPPHLEDYYAAQAISHETGHTPESVLAEFDNVRPQEVFSPPPEADPTIRTLLQGDTVGPGADTPAPIAASTPETEVAALENVEAQDYREYDVHFMMYPLGHDILGTGVETRPSHAFIVVTEAGVDPRTLESDSPEALIVTRGGPDRGTYDFRPDTNIQSPTDNNRDGDVYVMDHAGSAKDLDHGGVRLIRTTRITGDIDDIRDNVDEFRFAVNSTDINYHAPWQNSNTYAGDVYENLTGQEPPNTVQWPHYMPGLGNDLPVEGDFRYRPDMAEESVDAAL